MGGWEPRGPPRPSLPTSSRTRGPPRYDRSAFREGARTRVREPLHTRTAAQTRVPPRAPTRCCGRPRGPCWPAPAAAHGVVTVRFHGAKQGGGGGGSAGSAGPPCTLERRPAGRQGWGRVGGSRTASGSPHSRVGPGLAQGAAGGGRGALRPEIVSCLSSRPHKLYRLHAVRNHRPKGLLEVQTQGLTCQDPAVRRPPPLLSGCPLQRGSVPGGLGDTREATLGSSGSSKPPTAPPRGLQRMQRILGGRSWR